MSVSDNKASLLQKLGVFAGGILGLLIFAGYPMYQASQGAREVSVSMIGIILSTMLLAVGANLLFLGDRGIPWRQAGNQPRTAFQKMIVRATLVVGLAMAGGILLYFHSMGYKI